MDASLPFSLRWEVAPSQDTTSLVAKHLNCKGLSMLNFIDDFGGVAASKQQAQQHFKQLQGTLDKLGLVEATHKASPPSHHMMWHRPVL